MIPRPGRKPTLPPPFPPKPSVRSHPPHMHPVAPPKSAVDLRADLYRLPKSGLVTKEIVGALSSAAKADAYPLPLWGGRPRRLMGEKGGGHIPPIRVFAAPTAGVDVELR